MARMAFKNALSFNLIRFSINFDTRRRSYAVLAAAENNAQKNTVKIASADSSSSVVGMEKKIDEKKQVFWMRDPKTGNWIPENHFNDIDVCDLRAKLLSK